MKVKCINTDCDQWLEHIEKYFECQTEKELAKKIGRSITLGCVFCDAKQDITVIEDGEGYALDHQWNNKQDGAKFLDCGYNGDDGELDANGNPKDRRKIHRITVEDNKGFSTDPDVKIYNPNK